MDKAVCACRCSGILWDASEPITLCPRLDFDNCRRFAEIQHLLCGRRGEEVHGPCNDPRPAGLMASPQPGAVVTMEILVKLNQIAPVLVLLELPHSTVHRSAAVLAFEKYAGQTPREFLGDLIQVHLAAGT